MSRRRVQHKALAALALLAAVACSDAAPSPTTDVTTGGHSASGGSPQAGSAPVPAAGAGGTGVTGGAAGSGPGSAGRAGAAGSSNGGAPTAGGTGLGGSASLGGAANGGAAGAAGAAGVGGDSLISLASELDKFRLECPCIDANHFGLDKQDNCDSTPAVDRQTYQKRLGGDPNVVYDVKLHVRGDTEPNTYTGGKLEQDRFYTGGQTSTPGYTAYMLSVADPKEVYFFNYNPTTSHIHFLIDYEVVIPMRGGSTVTFDVNGGKSVPDGHGVSNREQLVVPGIPPAPDPFNGQLVQFDVVSVQPHVP